MRVALTFDAEHPDRPQCPPGTPERIVELIREQRVAATFFLQGRWVSAYPQTARTIVDHGHVVGNHSSYHVRMHLLTADGIRADVQAAEERIRKIAGVDPRPWFRFPFGDGADDPSMLSIVESMGYRNVHWDVMALDWENDQTPAGVQSAVLDGVRAHGDGAIVLLHTWPAPTLAALPGIIQSLRGQGVSFVTVAEL